MMIIIAIVSAISILVLLTVFVKLNPFLAFVISSVIAAILLGIPFDKVLPAVETGIGNMVGSLAITLCLGAMFGKVIAETGAAQQIGRCLINVFGKQYITWALMSIGFILGIPLFYNVGFVLLVPLVFSVMYQTKLPAVYLGIPLLAALSITHGFLPPHPSPTALIPQFGANIGTTLFYGVMVAIPAMIIAGPLFALRLKQFNSTPLAIFAPLTYSEDTLPSPSISFFMALLPVGLIALMSAASLFLSVEMMQAPFFALISNPIILLLFALIVSVLVLGRSCRLSIGHLIQAMSDSIKDISPILLVIAGAGALKQVFIVGGVNQQLGSMLASIPLSPLVLAWLIATIIRIALGSATVAGLTAATIVAPLVATTGVDPNLMVLAVGAGSLMCSHVNDSGFWMFKEYFNLSVKDTFKTWSLMETIVGVMGLLGVLCINALIQP